MILFNLLNPVGKPKEKLKKIDFEIEIATERYDAEASLISLYDPDGSKMKL